ncbi:MAG TPA: hypothetical protein VGL70_06435 [Candidatus Binatia bacterium]|jgi:hypothetical protein
MTDFEKALLDPGGVFKTPAEVVQKPDLSRGQKIQILRQWEYDARELQVAEEESMTGPQATGLDAVLAALRSLGAATEVDRAAPTKHGGR